MLLRYVKRGARNSVFFSVSALLVRGLGFLFLPMILSALSLAEFGLWDLYQTFFLFVSAFVSSGLSGAIMRFTLMYKDDPLKQRQSIGNILLMGLLGAFVCCMALLLTLFFNIGPYFLPIIFCNTAFAVLFAVTLAYLRLREYLWRYIILYCGQYSIFISLALWGVHQGNGLSSFFYAQFFSYVCFAPSFFILFWRYKSFSWPLLKKQVVFIVPIIFFNVMGIAFVFIDRLFIKSLLGLEALGLYAVMWRFGNLFQYISMAIHDACPVVFFNAQNEDNASFLIPRLFSYMFMAITSISLLVINATQIGLSLILPDLYDSVVFLIPYFYMYLLALTMSRFLQLGFHLATNTFYKPFLLGTALLMQGSFFWVFSPRSYQGIFLCNIVVFSVYSLASYIVSGLVYKKPLFESIRTAKLLFAYTCMICVYAILFAYNFSWYYMLSFNVLWLVALWFGNIIYDTEKRWILLRADALLYALCGKHAFVRDDV